MPASRGYAHREWGHPSRVSRRLARRRGCLMRCVHLTVCASRCHSIAASFRRGAALHRARRVRFSRRPGQDRTGARAGSQPWCRGASWQMWLEQRTKKTSADTPPPGPSRSYYTHARPGGRHARCHGPSRSLRPNDDPSRRGRPRAPAARAGAPSSHRRPLVDECNTAITTGCPESTPGG